jgi:hypothetical protein
MYLNPSYFLQNYMVLLICANINHKGMTDFLSKMKTTRPFRVFHRIFVWFPSFGR